MSRDRDLFILAGVVAVVAVDLDQARRDSREVAMHQLDRATRDAVHDLDRASVRTGPTVGDLESVTLQILAVCGR